jgi:hypothetical protein
VQMEIAFRLGHAGQNIHRTVNCWGEGHGESDRARAGRDNGWNRPDSIGAARILENLCDLWEEVRKLS